MTQARPFQHVSAGGMSLLVHGLFVAFLLFSVSWRNLPQLPVEAELWSSLPEPPPPLPELPLEAPAAVPPQVAKPEVAKPDIALERAEKKRREQEALRLKEEARQEEMRRRAEETARLEKEKQEKQEKQEKLRREQARREQARLEMEEELARQAHEELDAEETQLRGAIQKQQANASRKAHLIGENQDRIRSRIRAYLRLPQHLVGNPEVVFQVALLPNGEVLRTVLLRGSGQAAYDQEVERAILKASPLPLPNDREAAAAFRDGLILKFRPRGE